MKHCQMLGMHSKARLPIAVPSKGTGLQPSTLSPSFSAMISNIFFAWFLNSSNCGKKNIPTP